MPSLILIRKKTKSVGGKILWAMVWRWTLPVIFLFAPMFSAVAKAQQVRPLLTRKPTVLMAVNLRLWSFKIWWKYKKHCLIPWASRIYTPLSAVLSVECKQRSGQSIILILSLTWSIFAHRFPSVRKLSVLTMLCVKPLLTIWISTTAITTMALGPIKVCLLLECSVCSPIAPTYN